MRPAPYHQGGARLRDAERHQRDRYIGDPWDEIISSYAAPYFEVEIPDILTNALHLDKAKWSQTEQNRVARCLRAQGYSRVQVRSGDKRVWRYRKGVTGGDTEDNNENVTPLKLVTTSRTEDR
jgi:hypothetical protein